MSVLASILLAWAAVHTFAAVSYGFLAMRRPRPGELRSFAFVCVGLAAFTVGSALLTDARSFRAAAHGQLVMAVGIEVAFAAFVQCSYDLLGRPETPLVRYAAVWACGSIALVLAGFFFDPSAPLLGARPYTPGSGATFEVAPTLVAAASSVGGVVMGTVACWDLLRSRHTHPDANLFLLGSFIALLAYGHDTATRLLHVRSLHLLEHATVLGSILMSYVLLRRFVDAGDELSARTRELRMSYDELHSVQERLLHHEQLAAIGELSAVIAHEVKNPLAILKNAVDGLRRPSLAAEDRNTLLQVLDEEADRLNRLVRDLLAYSKPVEIQAAAVPIAALVDRAMDLARRAHPRSADIHFDVDLNEAPVSIPGDADLLERALINVIENAIHAMPAGGTLAIRARPSLIGDRAAVALAFADTGTGMDKVVRSRAREAFFTTRPTGTGLGLAIVERVASAHAGRVELGDNPEGGTTVTLVLATA